MDECIGEVMPLWFPVHNIHDTLDWERFVESELELKTCVLNPVFMVVIEYLYIRYTNKEFEGAFIFSNNGSQDLVETLVTVGNILVQQLHDLEAPPSMFKVGFSAESPSRAHFGVARKYEKSFEIIQHCLGESGLRPCSSVKDLLFFDDQVHVLKGELGSHYCQVRPYKNVGPSKQILETLMNYQKSYYEVDEITDTLTEMTNYEQKLIKMGHPTHLMVPDEMKAEVSHWISHIHPFFYTKGGTRKRDRSRKERGERNQVRAKSLRKKTRRG
jgi:hypothetical protein